MWQKIARWTVMLLILAGTLGGGVAWYVWVQGDQYAREAVYRKLSEIAPACRIEMGTVSFDWEREVAITDLKIGSKSSETGRFLVVPELTIEINREAFLDDQTVVVERICMIRPHLQVTRRVDGTWTSEDLLPLHVDPTMPVPAWDIQDATLSFRLAQPDAEPIELTLEHADFLLKPTGRRQLSIEGRSRVADAGPVAVTGDLDLREGKVAWSLAGSVQKLNTSGSVAGFAWNASDAFRNRLKQLEGRLDSARTSLHRDRPRAVVLGTPEPLPEHDPFKTVSRERAVGGPAENDSPAASPAIDEHSVWAGVLARLGIEATVDADFSVADPGEGQPLDYELHLTCRDGKITNPLLPFPLSHLRGRLDWDRDMLTLRSVSARNGSTSLTCDGEYRHGAAEPTGSFSLAVENLQLGDNDLAGVPEPVAKCLAIIRPRGPIDVSGKIERLPGGRWLPKSVNATVKGVAISAEPFPYPVSGVMGTIRQSATNRWDIDLNGQAGTRPAECHGFFTSPAAGSEIELHITGGPLPIDETLRAACNPEARRVIETINLQGLAHPTVKIVRAPGEGMPVEWGFKARVTDASLSYDGFPYRLSEMSGDVAFDSVNDAFTFRNVTGRHDNAVLTGHGSYRKPIGNTLSVGPSGEVPGLDLTLSGEEVALDGDLREALPASLQQIWDDLRPGGISDFDARIIWIPGYQPDIELTKISVREGQLNPRAMPYPLESIAATARFIPWRQESETETARAVIHIDEFVGWHEGTRLAAEKSRLTLGVNDEWSLDLENFEAEDFVYDADVRQAAPAAIRETLETLKPRGKFLVEGKLGFTGTGDVADPPTVSWNLTTSTQPNTSAALSLGTEITGIAGRVHSKGERQGESISASGSLDLDQATVLGQLVTDIRGPFTVEGDDVVVGSLEALPTRETPQPKSPPLEQQLRGDLLDGLLTLNAHVQIGKTPKYHAYATLSGGSLEKYVAASIDGGPGQLAGVMNGHISVWGAGTNPHNMQGSGQLDIVPASLYRLPAIMEIFRAFSFAPPNGPAFSSARLVFTIHDAAFHFQPHEGGSIVLAGDTLRLVGGGRVGFDRVLDLEFYSSMPRDAAGPLRNVPLLRSVVGGLVKTATNGLFKVVVTGRADNPHVNTVPLPVLPDTWQNIMSTLGPRRGGQPIGFR